MALETKRRRSHDKAAAPTCTRYDIYIGAPVSKVWKGIVDGDMTKHYVYGTRLDSKLKKGTPYAYVGEGEFKVVDGNILEDRLPDEAPGHDLEALTRDDSVAKRPTFARHSTSCPFSGQPTTKLHLVHDDFDGPTGDDTWDDPGRGLAAHDVVAEESSRDG